MAGRSASWVRRDQRKAKAGTGSTSRPDAPRRSRRTRPDRWAGRPTADPSSTRRGTPPPSCRRSTSRMRRAAKHTRLAPCRRSSGKGSGEAADLLRRLRRVARRRRARIQEPAITEGLRQGDLDRERRVALAVLAAGLAPDEDADEERVVGREDGRLQDAALR